MQLFSKGFHNGIIDAKYGICSGQVERGVPLLSFPLNWTNPPQDTKSFALTFMDFDNIPDEGVCWIHWIVAEIPKTTTKLEENESRINPKLIQGRNSWCAPFNPYQLPPALSDYYGGPAPFRSHEYEVCIYALNTFLDLKQGFYYNEMRKRMEGHILEVATLKGVYQI